jgi:hypothetical protein
LTAEAALQKGAPFAGYKDWDACISANSGKDSPEKYCGYIKHRVEDSPKKSSKLYRMVAAMRPPWFLAAEREIGAYLFAQAASSLPVQHQVTDPNNVPTPQADQFDEATMFPLNPEFQGQWVTGPNGPQPVGQKEGARGSMTPSTKAVKMFGRMDAMEGKDPHHKDNYPFSAVAHGNYTKGWAETRGVMDGTLGKDPMSRQDFGEKTGRPDLHRHYLEAHEVGRARKFNEGEGSGGTQAEAFRRRAAADSDTRPAETLPTGEQVGDQDGDLWGGKGEKVVTAFLRPRDTWTQLERQAVAQSIAVLRKRAGEDCPNCDHPRHEGQCRDGDCSCTYAGRHLIHSVRKRGDMWSRPLVSTDNINQPFNRPETTPQPWASNMDVDAQAGARDGAEDARNGQRPTFMDNSSQVSPYVKAYAESYAQASEQMRGQGPQDVPGSMGGDSGQAQNAQQAQTRWQVAQGVRKQAAGCLSCGCTPHLGQPCSTEGCRCRHLPGEEGAGPGMHARPIGWVPDPGAPGYSMRPGGTPSEPAPRRQGRRLRVSAAFVTRRETSQPDFRKGYRFAVRWRPGDRLVSRGTPAFEAGLYAGISDSPGTQERWVTAHKSMAGRHPALVARLAAHQSFTAQWATSHPDALVRGLYVYAARDDDDDSCDYPNCGMSASATVNGKRLCGEHARDYRKMLKQQGKTAGTSTDLITDGPGTSPDPMGSTPLNGPGTPPPSGGRGEPARPGGAPPYQGAPPIGAGPVVTDDVAGQAQEGEQPAGPLAQGFSGPGTGLGNQNQQPRGGIDLAPTAPNMAAGPGYSNEDADQGNPHHKNPKAAAFRATVQANLRQRREMAPV